MNPLKIFILLIGILLLASIACTEKITQETKTTIGNRPPSSVDILRGLRWSHVFQVENAVDDTRYSWQTIFLSQAPNGTFDIDSTGSFTFRSEFSDSGREYRIRVLLGNGAEIVDNFDFSLRVKPDAPLAIQIERTHRTMQGTDEFVSVFKISGTQPIGQFDCAIAYDSNYLQFDSVVMGQAIGPDGCNWDRVDYELITLPDVDSSVTAVLRLSAVADDLSVNGTPHCLALPDTAEIFRIRFNVKADNPRNCELLPLRFIWTGCHTNAAYSSGGDTSYVATKVFGVNWKNEAIDITNFDCDSSYAYSLGGECGKLLHDCVPLTALSQAVFTNGGIGLVCVDSIDGPGSRGDMDCNGIGFEVSDLVFYRYYFLFGRAAFDPNPAYVECQILGSEANGDRIPLTIADYVYMLRVFVGDALPPPKLHPYQNEARVLYKQDTIGVFSDTTIGGIHAIFAAGPDVEVINIGALEMASEYRAGEIRILISSGLNVMTDYLAPGTADILVVRGNATLESIEFSDHNGNLLFPRSFRK